MRKLGALVVAVLVAGCAASDPPGPDAPALSRLIADARPALAAPRLRRVDCGFIAEEGSEWRCRYQEQASDGRWVQLETFVAADRSGWILIDGVRRADD